MVVECVSSGKGGEGRRARAYSHRGVVGDRATNVLRQRSSCNE